MEHEHAYCPHCRQLLLEDAPHPYPQRPLRCSGCRLLVGPGRARAASGGPRAAPLGGPVDVGDPVLDVLAQLGPRALVQDLRDGVGPSLHEL